MKHEKCLNCGEPTNFGNAVGERSKKKWCSPCYNYWLKHRRVDAYGREFWANESRSLHRGTPYDARPPKE